MKRILWFRRDLRVEDNPLLSLGGEVLPIFIFDTNILMHLSSNDKRVSFIFQQVVKLKKALQSIGLDLKLYIGKPVEVFVQLEKLGFDEVVASGDYDSYAKQRDLEVSLILHFNYLYDTYIFEPDEILKKDETPYVVFTPFYNKAKEHFNKKHLQEYTLAKHQLFSFDYEGISKLKEDKEKTLPLTLVSIEFIENIPQITDVKVQLQSLKEKLANYEEDRNYLAQNATSGLSVYLRFGALSIRSLLRFLVEQKKEDLNTEPFFRQLVFRDFYAYLLYHFPALETENYKYRFKGLENEEHYKKFCIAKTGVPIIDAGVKELLETGLMHNRARMVCASFFTKDLLLPWQWGEAFFAKYLLDYDIASNVLSWQWSAGTGIDPQPYFRIFNPYLQSNKFDKDAKYIKKWIPELYALSSKQIHDENFLFNHSVKAYPKPMIHHKKAAQEALVYFKKSI